MSNYSLAQPAKGARAGVQGRLMKWEVTISEFEGAEGKKYKVTRRMPEMLVAETRIFKTKEAARKQFEEWLQ